MVADESHVEHITSTLGNSVYLAHFDVRLPEKFWLALLVQKKFELRYAGLPVLQDGSQCGLTNFCGSHTLLQ